MSERLGVARRVQRPECEDHRRIAMSAPMPKTTARQVGWLIARSGLNDTVDVAVVEGVIRRSDVVVTSNRAHLEQVADAVGQRLAIHDV